MRAVYGDEILSFPTVLYDPDYRGFAYAFYKDGIIGVTDAFFKDPNIQETSLIHEYIHYTLGLTKYNIAYSEDGRIITIITNEPFVVSSNEYKLYLDDCTKQTVEFQKELPSISVSLEVLIQDCMSHVINTSNYVYRCSNYYYQEIEARKAELAGESAGLYVLPDYYREQREVNIEMHKYDLERSLDYEQRNGLNPDGTKK